MPTLKIANNSAPNPISVDLSPYLKLGDDGGVDPADPNFTQRIFSRSLLKEGATLALQQLVEKEQQWPVLLGPYANQSAMAAAIVQINQVINTPGAVLSWQDDGMSQPTYFDLLSGELQVQYSYRKGQRSYTSAKLLTFSQPLGRTASPRPYAAGSAVGPLLMISPYASSGALAIGASTQAGVAGFGGQQQGASSGVFYFGAPSLAGDARALLQVSYVGPLPNGASNAGAVPYVAVSLLPDAGYTPLITAPQLTSLPAASQLPSSSAVASQYLSVPSGIGAMFAFNPVSVAQAGPLPLSWSGQHRLLAIARASQSPRELATAVNALVATPTVATVAAGDWGLYDLGTFALRASEGGFRQGLAPITLAGAVCVGAQPGPGALDLTALIMLPDNATWFLPGPNTPSAVAQIPVDPNNNAFTFDPIFPNTNTVILDDVLGDQFLYAGASLSSAPSPIGAGPSASRMTQITRGLVPRPDPRNGLPILAVVGVGQFFTPSLSSVSPGASWANPQNRGPMAQVNVLERTRYVLP